MSSPTPSAPVPLANVVELHGHGDRVFNIVEMPDGRRVATACGDKVVRVFDAQTGSLLHALSNHTSAVFALAPLGQDLLASGDWSTAGTLCVWDTSTGKCLSKRPMGGCIAAIAKLGEREMVLSAGADVVFVSHTRGRRLVESRRVTGAIGKLILDLAAGGGRVVTGAHDGSVRVWDAYSGASVAELVAHGSCVRRVSVNGRFAAWGCEDGSVCVYRLDTLELVRSLTRFHDREEVLLGSLVGTDGGYVVSAGIHKMMRVSEVATGRELVRAELGFHPSRIRLLRDGRVAAGGGLPYTPKIFELPGLYDLRRAAASAPSPAEAAFRSVIAAEETGDDTLSVDLLSNVLVRENINSVSAFFWAHNLVLLAIRCEILTADAIHSFRGNPFYILEEVYFPVLKLKLSDEEKLVVKKVLEHAHSVGIINRSFDTVAAWDLREAASSDMRTASGALVEMAERISSVETRLDEAEDENKSANQWSDAVTAVTVTAKIDELVGHSEKRRNDVLQLIRSFSELHSRLRKGEERTRVITHDARSVTRAALSVIPVVGSAVGNASYAAAEMLLGSTPEKLVEVGVGAAKDGGSLLGGVDVSNFSAARRLLSEKGLDKLGPAAKRVVFAAAEGSAFKSFGELEKALDGAARSNGSESANVARLLDLSDKSWMSASKKRSTPGSGPSSAPQDRGLESTLPNRFKFLCSEEGRDDIPLDAACDELLPLLSRAGYEGSVDKDVVYDALEEACGEDSRGRVDEKEFSEAYEALLGSFTYFSTREESHACFTERFLETAGTIERVSVRQARLALLQLFKDRNSEGGDEVKESGLDFKCVSKELSKEDCEVVLRQCCDAEGVEKVGIEEFIMACRTVFYGEEVASME